MKDSTDDLLKRARNRRMTREEREEQRRSFAFGNSNIENDTITRDSVKKEAETIRTSYGSNDGVE